MAKSLDASTYERRRSDLRAQIADAEQKRDRLAFLLDSGDAATADLEKARGAVLELRDRLSGLERQWQEQSRAAEISAAADDIRARNDAFGKIQRLNRERARTLAEIEKKIEELGPLVASYNSYSEAILEVAKPFQSDISKAGGNRAFSELAMTVRDRVHETVIVKATAFDAGLWGIGTLAESFRKREFGVDRLNARKKRDILHETRAILPPDMDLGEAA